MTEFKIIWTAAERPAAGGATTYYGTVNGERLYVVTGRPVEGSANRRDRTFIAKRRTSAAVDYPVGSGGVHKRYADARAACETELAAMRTHERETLLGNLRERRELIAALDDSGAGREAHRMTLPELREALDAARLTRPDRRLTSRSCCASTTGDVHDRSCPTIEAREQWRPRSSSAVDMPAPNHPLEPLRQMLGRTLRPPVAAYDATLPEQLRGRIVRGRFPAAADELPPLPPQVTEYDDGETVWRIGDRVRVGRQGSVWERDVWRIRAIAVPLDGREPYAGLVLVERPGGLPIGETGTGLALRQLRRAGAERSGLDWAALRAERDRLREQVAKLSRPVADVLRKLRDDHLLAWVEQAVQEDEARQVRDPVTDPELVVLHAADVRSMIEEVARELGAELDPKQGPQFAVGHRVYPRGGGGVLVVQRVAEIEGSRGRQQFWSVGSSIPLHSDDYAKVQP